MGKEFKDPKTHDGGETQEGLTQLKQSFNVGLKGHEECVEKKVPVSFVRCP